MPALIPGQRVIRLDSSQTRNIPKGSIGVIGGLNPTMHDNSNSGNWSFSYFPVQWLASPNLWSNLDPAAREEQWEFYPPPTAPIEEDD